MRRAKQILSIILLVSLLTGCEFVKRAFTYKDKTKELMDNLLKGDYKNVRKSFAMEHEMAKNTDTVAMREGLMKFRESIIQEFGTDLNYTFMKAEKIWSTEKGKSTPPNTTVAQIEFSNDKDFGVFRVLFDDISGKILRIESLDVKQPIPGMALFWLFGLLALCVPVFNIYVIRKVKRSDLKKKWLKYLAIFIFNTPAFTYAAVAGFSFKLLNFQILLGISFGYMGFLNAYWTVGLPLGGLYWFLKLRSIKNSVVPVDGTVEPQLGL